jgi:hypothetical protein
MSRIAGWLLLAALAVASPWWSTSPAGAQPAATAEVILARAPVEVVPRGQTAARPLQRGARLSAGDRVRTGRGGAAEVVLGDGSLVRLGELSDLEIEQLDVDAAGQPTASRFALAAGQARAWVARQVVAKVGAGTGRFAMQTPTAVAAVRQTDFAAVHLANGISRIYTLAGAVESRNTAAGVTGFVVCTRNRYTEIEPGREPKRCQVIPFRERRRLFGPDSLAVEAVALEPNNLDLVAIGALVQKLVTEKMTGTWAPGGDAASTGRQDAPSEGQGTADVTVTVQ